MGRRYVILGLLMLIPAVGEVGAEEFFRLENASFENPVLAEGFVAYYTAPGWAQLGSIIWGTSHPADWQALNRDGDNVMFGYGGVSEGVKQNIGHTFDAFETYRLTVKICRPAQYYDWNVPHDSVGKIALAYAETGVEVASHTETIYIVPPDPNMGDHPAWGTMMDYSVEYIATEADATHEIQIKLIHLDNDGVYFDDVRLSYTGDPLPFIDCEEALAEGYGQVGDLNADCTVNIEDLVILGAYWLGCIDPAIEGCDEPWASLFE